MNVGPAESLDLGKIVLDSGRRAITGVVLDSAGKPVAGTLVFNTGDADARLSTRADAAGRFRLEGFRLGPAYIFAQHPGYRFKAVLADESGEAIIQLLRSDEPLPPRAQQKQLSKQRRQELARALIEKVWATGNHPMLFEAIMAMGMVDLQKAQQWADECGPRYRELSSNAAALRAPTATSTRCSVRCLPTRQGRLCCWSIWPNDSPPPIPIRQCGVPRKG